MPWASRDTVKAPAKAVGGKQPYSAGPRIAGLDDEPSTAPSVTISDPSTGEVLRELPGCDMTNPADLEAWYGNYGFVEHFRKVVLATCREIVRAKATLANEKMTVDRADDLARTSDTYVEFLTTHLKGRRLREQNVLDSMANR